MKKEKDIPGIDISNLDASVSPGKDFYHFANGGWLKNHPIPDEFARYGTFDKLREENREIVKSIIEEVASTARDHIAALVGDFYSMGMDTQQIDSLGHKPIEKDLDNIRRIKDKAGVSEIMTSFYSDSLPIAFYVYPSPDRDNSEWIIANLHQGGMGLPDVDYYRNDDDRSKEIRKEYISYITRMLQKIEVPLETAGRQAEVILGMESRLAHAGMTRLEQRDPHKTFNKHTLAELEVAYPRIQWKSLLKALQIDENGSFNVGQPDFFKELSVMIDEISLNDWKAFLQWRILNMSADYISASFEEEKFNFYGKFLSDKKKIQPRWKRVTSATENALGEAIGKLFVERYFPPSAKKRMLELVENLRVVLKRKIENLEWMSADTRVEALEKLARMRVKIGYPDKWRAFDELAFENRSYFENYRAAAVFNMKYELAKIGKPADKDEWHMTPQTVNAYYHPLLNEIVFPAGILQPPFFYEDADDAVNYGAIGVVIGHEMTHGFDDQGRKFDKNGNLNDWWKEEDAERFNERAKVLEDQYNRIRISGDLFADGKLSLGENIADLGGINIAFDALIEAWKMQQPEAEIDGYTAEQRFFLSYAHLWANNIRQKEMIRLTKEDVHSLGINRVNGPLPNVEQFYKAFNVKKGDDMYLEASDRASIW